MLLRSLYWADISPRIALLFLRTRIALVWDDVEEDDIQVPVVTAVTEPQRTNYNTSHVAGISHYLSSTQPSNSQ